MKITAKKTIGVYSYEVEVDNYNFDNMQLVVSQLLDCLNQKEMPLGGEFKNKDTVKTEKDDYPPDLGIVDTVSPRPTPNCTACKQPVTSKYHLDVCTYRNKK